MGQYATFDIDVKGFKVIIKRAVFCNFFYY